MNNWGSVCSDSGIAPDNLVVKETLRHSSSFATHSTLHQWPLALCSDRKNEISEKEGAEIVVPQRVSGLSLGKAEELGHLGQTQNAREIYISHLV